MSGGDETARGCLSGIAFYDDEDRCSAYCARRDTGLAPNELLEQAPFDDLLGEVQGLDVLDLGCGDGRFGRDLLARGCRSYVGVDGSWRMAERARRTLSGTNARVVVARLEDHAAPAAAFDVVVSKMTFHYLRDLGPVLAVVAGALRPGGRLVFSVEHPTITCSNAARPDGARRAHWVVDDYFVPGPRTAHFFGVRVARHHRSIEEHFVALKAAGFDAEDLREGAPSAARVLDPEELRRRRRIPLMLILSARLRPARPGISA